MTIPFKKIREAVEILSAVTQQTRGESGCVSCNVYRRVDSDNSVMIEEVWQNEKDLEHHLRSDKYQRVLLVSEMASVPPEIRFFMILCATGVEPVEKARPARGRENLQ